jgi:hypothetical protein
MEKMKDMSAKSEGFYDCIDRTEDPVSGGFIYKFVVKKEFLKLKDSKYDKHSAKQIYIRKVQERLYPGTQLEPEEFEDIDIFPSMLLPLGYAFSHENGVLSFTLPDQKVLMSRANQIYPDLLNIVSTNGIADSKTFIQEFINGNTLLSDDKEFLHDHLIHVISKINFIHTTIEIDEQQEKPLGTTFKSLLEPLLERTSKLYDHMHELEKHLIAHHDKKYMGDIQYILLSFIIDLTVAGWSLDQFFLGENIFKDSGITNIESALGEYLHKQHAEFSENSLEVLEVWEDLIKSIDDPSQLEVLYKKLGV